MNKSNIVEVYNNNFSIGSHGFNHLWWKKISKTVQEEEIKKSFNYFKKIKVFNNNFSVCFPYGSFNSNTFKILKKYKVEYALTTNVGAVNHGNIKKNLELPRFDTNDFKN